MNEEYFASVIGYDEVKNELSRILDTLIHPEKYEAFGVRPPKNLLLYGDVGLGKSLMAKCFIKATGRKTYIVRKNKSDGKLVDEISNVFESASHQPSVILLDDLDRFANEDEKRCDTEEYLAVQSGIDAFGENSNVFVVATCNRIEKLPGSLIRPGRFDITIEVKKPRGETSKKIVEYYLRDKKVSPYLNLDDISRALEGRSCAELETCLNDAGIEAAFHNKAFIEKEEMTNSILKYVCEVFPEKTPKDPEKLERIAIHEASHAAMAEILNPGSVSLASTALDSEKNEGVVAVDYYGKGYSAECYENEILVAFSGKAGIELRFGTADPGSSGDMRRALRSVDRLVDDFTSYGLNQFEYAREHSPAFYEKKESSVFVEAERYYAKAKRILHDNYGFVTAIADALMKNGTLYHSDIETIRKEYEKNKANCA